MRAAPATAPIAVPPESVATEIKAGLLRAADDAARGADAAVSQVIAGYLESRQRVLVANSLGALVTDDRTRVRFTVQVVARRDGVIQTGYESLGKSLGFEIVDEQIARAIAAAAAGKAVTMLDARPAPTGPTPVVMGNGFGGTLFHEACGHGLEADGIAKGSSIYEGKIGAVVAAPIVNAYDDGTIAGEWGSAGIDDEGAPTQKTVVIDEGRLRGFLYDGLRARGEGVAQTGNGRRQSFRHVPIPRMTTTCIAPGQASADDIIAATERGFYAKTPGRRPGRAGQRQLRLRGGRGLPHRARPRDRAAARRHPRGQRHRHPQEHRHDRRRLRGEVGHLRQGRPERAGGHRPGDPAHRGHDGRWHRLMIDDVDRLLELALARGAAAAEVYAEESVTRRVKVFRGAVEELTSARRKGVGLRVFQEGSVGYAYTSDLSDGSYAETVATALGNARVADHDPDSVLPVPREQPAEVDVYDAGLERATDDERIDLALAVERAALAADPRVKSVDESVYADGDAQVYLANSPACAASIARATATPTPTCWASRTGRSRPVSRSPSGASRPTSIRRAAAPRPPTRAVALLGAAKPKTTKTTVVLDPFVSASFFGVLSTALTAEAVQKGRSLFAGRLGEQIAGQGVTLTDDGIHPDGLASAPFDGEGVPCRRTTLIADGVLRGFLYNVRSGPPRRPRIDRQRRPRLLPDDARGGADQPRAVGPPGAARPSSSGDRARRPRDQRHRHPLGGQPGIGRVLGGHQRPADRGRPRHHAGARGHDGRRHRVDAAQHRGPGRRRPLATRQPGSSPH